MPTPSGDFSLQHADRPGASAGDPLVVCPHGTHTRRVSVFALKSKELRNIPAVRAAVKPGEFRIFTCNGTSDSSLRRNGVRAGRKHFGNDCCIKTGLGKLQCRAQPRAAAANNYTIKRKNSELGQDLYTPENLHTPHEVSEQHQQTQQLKNEANHSCCAA